MSVASGGLRVSAMYYSVCQGRLGQRVNARYYIVCTPGESVGRGLMSCIRVINIWGQRVNFTVYVRGI